MQKAAPNAAAGVAHGRYQPREKWLPLQREWQEAVVRAVSSTVEDLKWMRCEARRCCTGGWYQNAPLSLFETTVDLQRDQDQLLYSVRASSRPYACPLCVQAALEGGDTASGACEWCSHELEQLREEFKASAASFGLKQSDSTERSELASQMLSQRYPNLGGEARTRMLLLVVHLEGELDRCIDQLHDEHMWEAHPGYSDHETTGFDLPPGTQLHLRTKARMPTNVYKVLQCTCSSCGAVIEHDRNTDFSGPGTKQPGPLFRHFGIVVQGPDGQRQWQCKGGPLSRLFTRTLSPSVSVKPSQHMARLWEDMCRSQEYKTLQAVAVAVHAAIAREVVAGTACDEAFAGSLSYEAQEGLLPYARQVSSGAAG